MDGTVHASEHKVQQEAEAARDLIAAMKDSLGDDDEFRADFVEGETGLTEAIEGAIREIRECDIIAEGCASEIKVLSAREARARARVEKLRACIEQAMVTADVRKLNTPTKTLSISHRKGRVIVVDEAAIPAAYFKPQPPKLDRKALADALQAGPIPGATMSNGSVSLTMRGK